MSTMDSPAQQQPPAAPRHPTVRELHGDRVVDDYAWMRSVGGPDLIDYLAAERAFYDAAVAHTALLRQELFGEMAARMPVSEESARWRHGPCVYYSRTVEGKEYEQFLRAPTEEIPGEVVLDLNELASGADYIELGVRSVSPDHRLLAYSIDKVGDEVYQLRFRDLETGTDLPDRIERTYYTCAWSADSRHLFYTVTDATYRPYQIWRHELGTDSSADQLVYQEDDPRYDLAVRTTRSGEWIVITSACRDTFEELLVDATLPASPPMVVEPRRKGHEYAVDHGSGPDGGELYILTNDGAPEFRLMHAPVRSPGRAGWTELLGPDPAERRSSAQVFAGHVVLEIRRDFRTGLRVLDRTTGSTTEIWPAAETTSLNLATNEEYLTGFVTVRTESLIDPREWHDVDLVSGSWRLRKRQQIPGYDPSRYRTSQILAPATDGTPIPITLAYRADRGPDGTSPCLLYGYGAYEASLFPEFGPFYRDSLPSVLDRGWVFAAAHIRGGGEGGRRWWDQGHLAAKRNTFTDFIDCAAALVDSGWAAPGRIVTRGLSAGGLLQGAAYSMAPGRWAAVVAEVPFVDVVNSMLDETMPLTVNEWDEWGDPRIAEQYGWLRAYAPYENLPPAADRPPLLATGAVHDPRVGVHEPAKWVAKLRATDGDAGSRILFRCELGAGAHVGPAGRYDHLRYEAEIIAFALDQVGAADPADPAAASAAGPPS
ncbi:MAG TPA: prolyl oligopeptidase family serine peptidase [Actinomycetes bacterium]|nr:prolyl oligopeptidase family serine peptidase [Actinomycetes bacterium]